MYWLNDLPQYQSCKLTFVFSSNLIVLTNQPFTFTFQKTIAQNMRASMKRSVVIQHKSLTFHSWTRQIPLPPSERASDAAGAWEGGPTVPVTILCHSERLRAEAHVHRLPLVASRQFLGPDSIKQWGQGEGEWGQHKTNKQTKSTTNNCEYLQV